MLGLKLIHIIKRDPRSVGNVHISTGICRVPKSEFENYGDYL